ncbi:MAG: hypothetical protein HY873_06185 [Chloroflexi bacterium]|nr:hypothetical protein [Chloroflexota bacterium]
MPLENRNLEPGTVLVARYKKQERTCEVVQTDDGVRFRLDDGTEHRSPSSAGKQAMGGVACNGWRFWSRQGDLKPAKEPKAKKAAKAEKPAKAATKKAAKAEKPAKAATKKPAAKKGAAKKSAAKKGKGAKKKAARMASSGSYGCGACGQEFPTMKKATEHALTHVAE